MWLLMFQCGYCFIRLGDSNRSRALEVEEAGNDEQPANRPAYWKLAIAGILLGAVQALCNVPTKISSLLGMPMGTGALPFDIVAFAAGIICRRRDWLRAPFPASSTALSFVGVLLGIAFNYSLALPQVQAVVAPLNISEDAYTTIGLIFNGFSGVSIAYCTVAVFQRWFDFAGPISKRLARAAYVLHDNAFFSKQNRRYIYLYPEVYIWLICVCVCVCMCKTLNGGAADYT